MPLDNAPLSPLMADFEKVAAYKPAWFEETPLVASFHAFYSQAEPAEKRMMLDRVSEMVETKIEKLDPLFAPAELARVRALAGSVTKAVGDGTSLPQWDSLLRNLGNRAFGKAVDMKVSPLYAVDSFYQDSVAALRETEHYLHECLATPPARRKPVIPKGPRG